VPKVKKDEEVQKREKERYSSLRQAKAALTRGENLHEPFYYTPACLAHFVRVTGFGRILTPWKGYGALVGRVTPDMPTKEI